MWVAAGEENLPKLEKSNINKRLLPINVSEISFSI
jgi:hypothetical protein